MNATSTPLIQQHELTWQCNNNCLFCYNPERCLPTFTIGFHEKNFNEAEYAKVVAKHSKVSFGKRRS